MMTRRESDSIGTMDVPEKAYYGVQTLRAKNNFKITGRPLHPEFIKNLASAQESMQDAIADYCNGEAGDEDTQALAAAAAGADTSAGHAGMLNAQELIGILKQKEKALRQVASSSNALVSDTSNMLDDVSNVARYLAQTTDQMDYLIEDTKALKDSLN